MGLVSDPSIVIMVSVVIIFIDVHIIIIIINKYADSFAESYVIYTNGKKSMDQFVFQIYYL